MQMGTDLKARDDGSKEMDLKLIEIEYFKVNRHSIYIIAISIWQ
jgi:hypothetical protein